MEKRVRARSMKYTQATEGLKEAGRLQESRRKDRLERYHRAPEPSSIMASSRGLKP